MLRLSPLPCLILVLVLSSAAAEPERTLALPFASDSKEPRASFDIKQSFDLSTTDEIRVDLSVDKPEAVGSVSLYFHGGNGWYSMFGSISKAGRQTVVFSTAKLRTEDKPGPLDELDQLRLSFWRGRNIDADVTLYGWEFFAYPIVILNPENTKSDSEARTIAGQLRSQITSQGVDVGVLEQTELSAKMLENRRIVILPLNSGLTADQVALLQRFVESGGKLIAFYLLPPELMAVLGFGRSTYVKPPEGPTSFAEVRFEPWFVKEYGGGVPNSFQQDSWNIHSAKPLDGSDNFHAKIAAVWIDASGKPADHAALLVSDRGAFFSHILTGDDAEKKKNFLLALLAKNIPGLWTEIAAKRRAEIETVGATPFETETEKTDRLAKITRRLEKYRDEKNAREFCRDYPAIRKELSEQYIRSLPSKPGEFRAWWEHAGTGAYPGDWDRTMKELKENGFNAVIPNMLWGGLAHYDSKLLPRSQKFEQYGDQIEQAVRAGKKYGVQVHVWKVNYNCSKAPKEFVDKMRNAGRTQVKFDGEAVDWLCPSHPENRKLEWESMVEVVRNYDVDGIHFDYIRYPDSNHCYCDGCRERFEKHVGEKIADWPKSTRSEPWKKRFDDWRCDRITALVADVHREAKKVKPTIKISAAVFSRQSRVWVFQDWPLWVEKGYLDFLCPMDYAASALVFDDLVESQMKLVVGKIPVYPGIGATATGIALTPDQVATQIMVARRHGAPGFTIFNLSRWTMEKIPPALRLGPTKP